MENWDQHLNAVIHPNLLWGHYLYVLNHPEETEGAILINVSGQKLESHRGAMLIDFPFEDGKFPSRGILNGICEFAAWMIGLDCRVIVFCLAGNDRSALIVAMILHHHYEEMTDIIKTLREINPHALMHDGPDHPYEKYLLRLRHMEETEDTNE